MNCSDVREQFGASVNQASTERSRYIDFASDDIFYHKNARTYVRSCKFMPQSIEPRVSRYRAHPRSTADGIDGEGCWIAPHDLVLDAFRWQARQPQDQQVVLPSWGVLGLAPRSVADSEATSASARHIAQQGKLCS